jgi:heat shock protein HslJ
MSDSGKWRDFNGARFAALLGMSHSQRTDAMFRASVFVCLAFTISCSGPTSPSEAAIAGITWKLRSIQRSGASPVDIANPDRFTVRFDDDGRVAVRADCNVCTGGYELNGSSLQLTPLACTRAFCGTESPDAQFLQGLQPAVSVSTSAGILKLTAGSTILSFAQ